MTKDELVAKWGKEAEVYAKQGTMNTEAGDVKSALASYAIKGIIRSFSDELEVSSEWRPIETAPMNEWVLISFNGFNNEPSVAISIRHLGTFWLDMDGDKFIEVKAWQPLPKPFTGGAK